MDVTALALQASLFVFMISSLAGVGLGVAPRDVLPPLTNGRFVLLMLASGWLVGPAVALVLLRMIPIDRPYATALLLLALAPGAPFAPAMMRIARGDPAYVAAFMVVSAAVTVIVLPLGVPLLIPGATANAWDIARPLALLVVAPMVSGSAIRGLWPRRRRARGTDRVAHRTRRDHGHAGAGHARLRPRRTECRRQPRDPDAGWCSSPS